MQRRSEGMTPAQFEKMLLDLERKPPDDLPKTAQDIMQEFGCDEETAETAAKAVGIRLEEG